VTLDTDLADHIAAVSGLARHSGHVIAEITSRVAECFESGGKLLICGNGGSAADSQHFAAEFVNRMHIDRRALPAIALSTDTSSLTAIANDAQYLHVFARQVEALGRPGDVLIGISTSGRSANVIAALGAARAIGMVTIGFTGQAGAAVMARFCDIVLATPSELTPRIQEGHEFAYHVIAARVERRMFGRDDDN
jgi:D-sedoheptulose 7-phosphate isomerase